MHSTRGGLEHARHGTVISPPLPLCTAATVTGPTASNPAVVCRRGRCAQASTVCVCMYVCSCVVLAHLEGGRHVTHLCAHVLSLATWSPFTPRHTPGSDRRRNVCCRIFHPGAESSVTADSR